MVVGLCLLSTMALGAPEFEEIELRGREPLGIMVHTPSQEVGPVPTSYVLGVISSALAQRTNYLPREISMDSWGSCGGALPCIFANQTLFEPGMHHVVWVSNLTTGNTARVLIELIDVPAALRAARTTTVADLATYVAQVAVRHLTERTTLRSAEELGPLVQRFVDGMRPIAERDGQWDRSGTLLLEVEPTPMRLNVDKGRFELTLRAPTTRLLAVPIGYRHLELSADGSEIVLRDVEVTDAGEVGVKLVAEEASTPGSVARTASAWTGVGALVAGGSLIAAGAALAGRPSVCLVPEGTHCSPLGRGRAPVITGSSLAAGGLGLLVGALWVGPRTDWPWVGIVGSVVLGVATGVSISIGL